MEEYEAKPALQCLIFFADFFPELSENFVN